MKLFKYLMAMTAGGILVVAFQNCSKQPDLSSDSNQKSQSSFSAGTGRSGESTVTGDSSSSGGVSYSGPSSFKLTDSSVGNGTYMTRVTQKITSAGGPNLRGCTVLARQANQYCVNDSDYRVIGGSGDDWRYDAATDSYSADFAVQWPFEEYVTRYILPNGTRKEVRFMPALLSNKGPYPVSGYKWVYTQPKACIGPTPAPAPIGQACSTPGETRTNACGTATCQ